jgi:hypothetical protein
MNAQEAEAAYRTVKSQVDAGQIALDEYNRRVAELRYQDNTGTWWAISPTDGSWLKWNGSVWEPAFAQTAPVAPHAPAAPQPAAQPAAHQPVQQESAKPSWYIPPVGSQKKPAAAQPAPQPAAAPSYYIPPAGTSQPQPVQQPATVVTQAAVAVSMKPKRNWTGILSLILGIISWAFYPYILGIAAIAIGSYSIYTTRKITGKIAIIAIAGIIIGLASIIADNFWLVLFPPSQGFKLIYWIAR